MDKVRPPESAKEAPVNIAAIIIAEGLRKADVAHNQRHPDGARPPVASGPAVMTIVVTHARAIPQTVSAVPGPSSRHEISRLKFVTE
jgi:hypothetical protein